MSVTNGNDISLLIWITKTNLKQYLKQKENVSPSKTGMKNGLAFEIILDNPKGKTPAKLTPCNTPTKTLTNEDIKNELVKAEERRQVIRNF